MTDNSLTLYFDLKANEKADLEVVAAAALHWVGALRAAASAIDPDAQIRMELIDADESSLKLNTILEWLEGQAKQIEDGSGQYPRLRKMAIALSLFIATIAINEGIDLLKGPPVASLNDQDRRILEELLERTKSAPEVEEEGRRFFRKLEQDPSISAVGVSESRDERPGFMVPSNQFSERGGLWVLETEPEERTRYREMDVILVQATLVSRPRAWTFQDQESLDEFTATMRDKEFIAALEERHIQEKLRTGIKMRIRLRLDEEKIDGEWKLKWGGRSVDKVIMPEVKN